MITRKNWLSFFLFIFLINHIIPLVYRHQYEITTQLNYGILLLLLLLSIKKNKINISGFILLTLVVISFVMYLLGFSGTILALILCASTPFFLFKNILITKKEFVKVFYLPVKISAIILFFGLLFLYFQVKDDLLRTMFLGSYFIIASINYVSLLLFSFSILFFVVVSAKNEIGLKKNRYDFIILMFLILFSIFFSFIFLTRITFVASVVLLFIFFRRRWKTLVILCFIFSTIYIREFIDLILIFIGSDTLSIDVAQDNRREDSVMRLINSAVNFDFNFRDNMSFSSLFNLIFSLFPLTFIFGYLLFESVFFFQLRIYYYIGAFLICLLISIYQMDFLSIFTLFFISEYIKMIRLPSSRPFKNLNEKHAI